MKVKIAELKKLARSALIKYGYDAKEVKVILDVLIYAQLRGNNQGLVKLIGAGIPKDKKAGKVKILKNTNLSVLIDGGRNFGIVVKDQAVDMVLDKVKKYGFGIVGIKNTFSSTGAIGYFAKKIAKKGYLGFIYPGSPKAVCHHGSYEPMYGTNPIAIGIPTSKEPVVLDMATSAMAWFGLVEAKTAGKNIPMDVAYDDKGKPTSSPAKAMAGAIRPFDRSYKGAGLSMIVEILCGPLVNAGFVGINEKEGWGNLIFAIDPELLTVKSTFKKNMDKLVARIKKSKKLPNTKAVYLPGERGDKLTTKVLKSGLIEIEKNLYEELKKVANK
ncbi:Ldh family oxidoreductase [Patescibacteria group bacterium]